MKKEKVAVIGSGISGLSTSLFLSNKFNVHLFEKNKYLGGHTRTINFFDGLMNLSIDTGFIVFNEKNYPDLTTFFNYLNVKTENTDMSFSFSSEFPNLEYGGANLNALFAQRNNIFSIKFFKLIFQIIKLYKIGRNFNFRNMNDHLTIEEFLIKNNFGQEIRDFHIYPMVSSIWSTNVKEVKQFPFELFVKFFSNHGLFDLYNRLQWKFVSGGSYNYVGSLIKKKLFNFSTNFQIKKITRKDNKIQLIDETNKIQIFDKIVLATHADQALKLLDRPTEKEKNILLNFQYSINKAYLHSDERFMPNKKMAWSSWNFLQNINKDQNYSLSYWMNKLQNISCSKNYFVTINPNMEPRNVIDSKIFEHPIFNMNTLMNQKKLHSIQGIENTYYCGSYCGYGFHEDGIQSAAYIAKKLLVELPWKRSKNFKSRLAY